MAIGRAALLGGSLFCRPFLFFCGFSQNYFILLYFFLFVFCYLFVAISSQIQVHGSDRRVRFLYSNIRGLHVNLDELTVAGSDYDVLVCAESKV